MRQPENDAPTRGIAVLGSTGSIGTQALDVIREQREALHVKSCLHTTTRNCS